MIRSALRHLTELEAFIAAQLRDVPEPPPWVDGALACASRVRADLELGLHDWGAP